MQNLFSLERPFKFSKSAKLVLEIYELVQETFSLCFHRKTQQQGKDCLAMIDNWEIIQNNEGLCFSVWCIF